MNKISGKPRPLRRLLTIVFYICLGQAALLAGGWTYQSVASADDRQRFPMPGERVDVGGYALHLYCSGTPLAGKATVVLEGGIGAPGLVWALVQPQLAAQGRVCTYDRTGYGWSDPGPGTRDARTMVAELHTLLQRAGENPPYLFVGHSFGGTIIRVYAGAYPDEVAGLVLVDARHEDFFERMPADYLKTDEENLRRARALRVTTPLGITRLAGTAGWLEAFKSYLAPLPDDSEQAAWALMLYNPEHWNTAVAEREALLASYAQARAARLPPQMPLVVLTAENGVDAWRPPGSPANETARATWMQLQEELAQLTRNSRWAIVAGSGHYIYFDRPGAIAEAVASIQK